MRKIFDFLRTHKITPELSEKWGIPLPRLAQIAAGSDPTMYEVRKIARALHMDPSELLAGSSNEEQASFLFRDVAKKADFGTLARLTNKISYSLDLLTKADIAGPWWSGQFERSESNYAEAEANARRFREIFFDNDQVGPILSLPQIVVNKLGVLLFLVKTEGIDGASAICDGIPFIFLAQRFAPRMLFTLAHEIAHLIAHHNAAESFAVIDIVAERPSAKKNATEFYAHSFASCLLMPAQGVGLALQQIRSHGQGLSADLGDLELLWLSRIYGVSFYAAARRCEDLRLLPRGGAASLDSLLRKKFGSPEKRAEELGLPDRPQIRFPAVPEPLLASAIEKVRSGELSIGRASEVLGLTVSDLMKVNEPSVH